VEGLLLCIWFDQSARRKKLSIIFFESDDAANDEPIPARSNQRINLVARFLPLTKKIFENSQHMPFKLFLYALFRHHRLHLVVLSAVFWRKESCAFLGG